MYRYIWKIKLHSPEAEQELLDYWRVSSHILQQYPGAMGSHAHKVRGEVGSYFFVAEWQSMDARDAMSHDIHNGDSELACAWRSLPPNDSFGKVQTFAGEEIDIIVTATKS
jgi:hypothetical protein